MTPEQARKKAEEWQDLKDQAERFDTDGDLGAAEECRAEAGEIEEELAEAGYDDPRELLEDA
jgi:hypothetical protein